MSRPDLFPAGDSGFVFDDMSSRDDTRRTGVIIAVTIIAAVLACLAAFLWCDRAADPLPSETLSPHWLRAPAQGFVKESRP